MSADNFGVIRKFPDGYKWAMGLGYENLERRLPNEKFRYGPFETYEIAYKDAYAEMYYFEYGIVSDIEEKYSREHVMNQEEKIQAIADKKDKEDVERICDHTLYTGDSDNSYHSFEDGLHLGLKGTGKEFCSILLYGDDFSESTYGFIVGDNYKAIEEKLESLPDA